MTLSPAFHAPPPPNTPGSNRLESPRRRPRVLRALALSTLAGLVGQAWGTGCEVPAATLASLEGVVEVKAAGQTSWVRATLRQPLCAGDTITVRAPGRAAVSLRNEVLVRLDQNSTLTLREVAPDADAQLGLTEGIAHVISRWRKRLGVVTPFINALVDGTEFTVLASPALSRVVVAEGRVRATNDRGEEVLLANQAAEASGADAPPRSVAVHPLEAVAWAIHYPQVVWLDAAQLAALPPEVATAVQGAQRDSARGRHAQALATLQALPEGTRPPAASAMLAASHLALGQVDAAERLLGTPAVAASVEGQAVRSVLLTARNDAQALGVAEAAVAAGPSSSAAALARSVALQATRQLPLALAAAQQATTLDATNPVAWARRAELELSSSQLQAGRRSAQTALALDGEAHRARAMLGMAELLSGQTTQALATLDAAIAADPSDPLAHFAHGVAQIRQGRVAEGRQDVELAALLDPSNAELRAYLGRAYLEEDRSKVAGDQFELAKRLDPASPTPWFFEAMQALQLGHPTSALLAAEQARRLNDNRATLRPSGLTSSDLSARSAQAARAYDAMGLRDFTLAEASRALAEAPSDRTAHEMLARTLSETEEAEGARTAAWTQASLRQVPGQWPLPSQFLMPTLPGLDNTQALSLDETTPLFDRRDMHFGATAIAGNQSTRGGSVLGGWSTEHSQIDLSAFKYQRDGKLAADDVSLHAARLHGLWALTPQATIHAEYSELRREGGDQYEPLIPVDGAVPNRQDTRQGRLLIGGRWWDPASDTEWLAAASRSRVTNLQTAALSAPLPPGSAIDDRLDGRPQDMALQYRSRWQALQWQAGLDTHRAKLLDDSVWRLAIPDFPPLPQGEDLPIRYRSTRAYAVASLDALGPWTLHAGLRRVKTRQEVTNPPPVPGATVTINETNVAKTQGALGAEWKLGEQARWHLSWFQTAGRPPWQTSSLEPVLFNAEVRDTDLPTFGTVGRALATTLDATDPVGTRWLARLRRDHFAFNDTNCGADDCGRWHRNTVQLSASRPITLDWFASASFGRHATARDEAPTTSNLGMASLRTDRGSLQLHGVLAPRWRASTEVVHVEQQGRTGAIDAPESASSRFWLVNASASWQPLRELSLELVGRNLLNKNFRYEDGIFDRPADLVPLAPGRRVSLVARWTLR